jgi:hypothetical protein
MRAGNFGGRLRNYLTRRLPLSWNRKFALLLQLFLE